MSRLTDAEVVKPSLLPEPWVWKICPANSSTYKIAILFHAQIVRIKIVDFEEDSSWYDAPVETVGYDVNPPVTGFKTLHEAMLYVEAWMLTGGQHEMEN